MTAQELYDGVARAMEVAKPAQEYCFLWINHWSTCMSKGEWSGWMQAIGAVVAIATAVLLPQVHSHLAYARNFEMGVHAISAFIGTAYAIGHQNVNNPSSPPLEKAQENFAQLVLMFDEVRASELPPGARPTWLAVRTELASCKALADKAAAEARSHASHYQYISSVREATTEALRAFSVHDPRLSKRTRRWLHSLKG